MTKLELAAMLERFVGHAPDCGQWEWDDFTSVKARPELEPFRQRLLKRGEGMMAIAEIQEIITELQN